MERFDLFELGLGSANKTGALLAQISIVSGLFFIRSRLCGKLCLGAICVISTICLVLTQSRGGLIALLAGLCLGVIFMRRDAVRLWRQGLSFLLLLICLMFFSELGDRVLNFTSDSSALVRFDLWEAGLRMIADAPSGWGRGNSGEVYMQWYQPLEDGYHFRTLLNDHLTWLSEGGMLFKLLYPMMWGGAILFSWPHSKEDYLGMVTTSVICSFGVASCFSSVGEYWVLWGLPLLLLFVSIIFRVKDRTFPSFRKLYLSGRIVLCGSLFFYFVCYLFSQISDIQVQVDEDSFVTIRPNLKEVRILRPGAIGLVVDPHVVGDVYGPLVRELSRSRGAEIIVYENTNVDIRGASSLIVCGEYCGTFTMPADCETLILLNPKYSLSERIRWGATEEERIYLVEGEFSSGKLQGMHQASDGRQWNQISVDGCGDYLPNWNTLVDSILR